MLSRNAMGVAVLAFGLATSVDAGPCRTYTGTFTAVAPAECSSPVGICTHGTLVGGFPSTYDFVADTLVPTGGPGEFAYTGHSVITTRKGKLFGSDSGHLTMLPDGTAPFVTTVQLVGGTRKYEGVTGHMRFDGRWDNIAPVVTAQYTQGRWAFHSAP